MDSIEMANFILGNKKSTKSITRSQATQTNTVTGVATSDSSDGTVMVDFGGDSLTYSDDQSVPVSTTTYIKKGDSVIVNLIGAAGTGKTPIVIGVVARGDLQQDEIDSANQTAAQASIKASIEPSGSTTLKNGKGSVTLTAVIKKGVDDVTDSCSIIWEADGKAVSSDKKLTVNATIDDSTTLYTLRAVYDSIEYTNIMTVSTVFDAVTIYIHSSQGTSFKNDSLNTVLTVTIYYGSETIKDKTALTDAFGSGAYIQWSVRKFGDAGFTVISSDDSHIKDNGFTYTVSASDVNTQAVFAVQLIT